MVLLYEIDSSVYTEEDEDENIDDDNIDYMKLLGTNTSNNEQISQDTDNQTQDPNMDQQQNQDQEANQNTQQNQNQDQNSGQAGQNTTDQIDPPEYDIYKKNYLIDKLYILKSKLEDSNIDTTDINRILKFASYINYFSLLDISNRILDIYDQLLNKHIQNQNGDVVSNA